MGGCSCGSEAASASGEEEEACSQRAHAGEGEPGLVAGLAEAEVGGGGEGEEEHDEAHLLLRGEEEEWLGVRQGRAQDAGREECDGDGLALNGLPVGVAGGVEAEEARGPEEARHAKPHAHRAEGSPAHKGGGGIKVCDRCPPPRATRCPSMPHASPEPFTLVWEASNGGEGEDCAIDGSSRPYCAEPSNLSHGMTALLLHDFKSVEIDTAKPLTIPKQ
eukprot:CAMPEP_0181325726 /NCGR_PEP_ID=MMETSP1101-20121128/21094_1 /TAXON_ID=46948 /ORGANISM="Rhodomonas abbreviata, Strain Caron Lab Isolate" /LENGTH=218 /DNA_ID=CAMNT_0023434083 /DNA_START=29 /DNA_END=686 /DNA_ORIENTATION=+